MQTKIKKIFHPILKNPVCDHLRAWLRISPPLFLRPLRKKEAISDLFYWRVDDNWETQYDLMNIPSLVFPNKGLVDQITMVFFDSQGLEISREQIELNPFESKKVLLRDFLKGDSRQGTFSCFHSTKGGEEIQEMQSYFNDRQYVSYSWTNDTFWNYVHGNIYCLSKPPKENNIRSVVSEQSTIKTYRPQLRLDDCNKFEVIYVNPLGKPLNILVQVFGENWQEVDRRVGVLPPRGLELFEFEDQSRSIVFLENRSRIGLLRPIVFKYYKSYFDVLHA